MSGSVDIYTLIFLVLAVVIFWKLRSVLGQRTGNERPPFDPFSRPKPGDGNGKPASGGPVDARPAETGTVIPLPRPVGAPAEIREDAAMTAADRFAKFAPAGTPLSDGLQAIAGADATFEPGSFLDGARTAYEMIVTAFAEGDSKALKPLLGREVFDGFSAAIGEREQRGETVEFSFVGIDKAEITDAQLKASTPNSRGSACRRSRRPASSTR